MPNWSILVGGSRLTGSAKVKLCDLFLPSSTHTSNVPTFGPTEGILPFHDTTLHVSLMEWTAVQNPPRINKYNATVKIQLAWTAAVQAAFGDTKASGICASRVISARCHWDAFSPERIGAVAASKERDMLSAGRAWIPSFGVTLVWSIFFETGVKQPTENIDGLIARQMDGSDRTWMQPVMTRTDVSQTKTGTQHDMPMGQY